MPKTNIPAHIGLLATGNELCEGDVLNTNGPAIARILMEHDCTIGFHVTASDAESDIVAALQFLLQHHNVVIITGGLGPTSDDRTRYALSTVIGQELIFDEASWENIKARLQRFGFAVHPDNRQQALFPQGAQIIPNKNGSAAGCRVAYQDKIIYMLPGPPSECLPMFNEFVLPALHTEKSAASKTKLMWKLLGAVEGDIAALIDAAVKPYSVMTGYRFDAPYLDVKIYTTQHEKYEEMLVVANNILNPYIVSNDNHTASELLRAVIKNYAGIISIEDNATYGRFEAALTTPDTREHLCFTQQNPPALQKAARRPPFAKGVTNILHIKIDGLKEFWEHQTPTGQISMTLKFTYNNKEETVEVTVPFRNQSVIHYAVEHAALRILRFLQKNHSLP